MSERVQGYCPMGCGPTLFLGSGGYVTCSWIRCPCPTAVADLLEDREDHHIVVLGDETFSIRHPLRERLEGVLFDCGLHAYLTALAGPPRVPGRYRVTPTAAVDGWAFTPLFRVGEVTS
jgi:hypothetical protein